MQGFISIKQDVEAFKQERKVNKRDFNKWKQFQNTIQ